jgi:hypothetical protein
VELIAKISDRVRLRNITDFLEHFASVLSLFLRVVEKERFRFKIENGVFFSLSLWAFQVDNTPGLQIFKTHECVTQLFLTLLERAVHVSLSIFVVKLGLHGLVACGACAGFLYCWLLSHIVLFLNSIIYSNNQ